jgi:hypothetical protein
MDVICKTAIINKQCRKLWLENNGINAKDITILTDTSVDNLIEMFTCNRSLQAVWLNDCSLSSNATKKLKQVVQSNTNFILEV